MAPTRTPTIRNSASVPMDFRNVPFSSGKRNELPLEKSMRIRMQNASLGGSGGGSGAGDRGAWQSMPDFTSNPYDSQDYVYRWRAYVHMYELSWEARKIIRIPIEDALRKPWKAEDIPEEMGKTIYNKLDQMGFMSVLKRSLMLERLLGGCLTFLGLDSDIDDTSKQYHPHEGAKLRFCNAIPVSRISRVNWDTNPISEGYMRPDVFLVNGEQLHVSRALVWDGEPLFDPYDFALTNFRSNLAGFGPSKLAPIWDDIIKAVGTRQAAYQLIQTNNAILIAINDMQDLSSTAPGQANLKQLADVANQLSIYKAAMIDGEKATVTQSAASFGSVPELILTFIQILSAASDIPATRFLGQAPGGLNATGDSDLENYYNVIDAFQQQRIAPALRRIYDVVGFQMFGQQWRKERDKLTFKFPPLWNATELEEAQAASAQIDNVMKLHEAGLISPEKVIEELNSKGALSVTLDEDDLANLEDMKEDEEINAADQIAALKGQDSTGGKFGGQPTGIKQPSTEPEPPAPGKAPVPKPQFTNASEVVSVYSTQSGKEGMKISRNVNRDGNAKYSWIGQWGAASGKSYDDMLKEVNYHKANKRGMKLTGGTEFSQLQVTNSFGTEFLMGMKDEQEHLEEVDGDQHKLAQIVMDHLKEDDQYYSKLRAAGLLKVETASNQMKDLKEIFSNIKTESGYAFYVEVDDMVNDKKSGNKSTELNSLDEIRQWVKQVGKKGAEVRIWDKSQRMTTTPHKRLTVENAINLEALPTPTEAQRHAGNYTKHHIRLHGIDIAVENPRGSVRTGIGADGAPWESELPAHYGYIKRTEGADGDHVDLFLGDNEDSELVFIIDQINLESGNFDEHKCILGCISEREALSLYKAAFSDGKGKDRVGAVKAVHLPDFKAWLTEGDTTLPFANEASFEEGKHKRASDGKFGSGGSAPKTTKEESAKPERKATTIKHTPVDEAAHALAKKLGIKVAPTWTNLQINTDPNADLVCRAKDGKGNNQRIYSVNHHTKQKAIKFERLKRFNKAYPQMLKNVTADIEKSDEAKALYLIMQTGFRVGGEKSTGAEHQAYGATTLTSDHVTIEGDTVSFDFTGKHGKNQAHQVTDPIIAKILSGKEGRLINTNEAKVLKYAKMISGNSDFKVHDFRTYVGTATAIRAMKGMKPPTDMKSYNKMVLEVCEIVAQKLGNTKEMARDSYVDPTVFMSWLTSLGGKA